MIKYITTKKTRLAPLLCALIIVTVFPSLSSATITSKRRQLESNQQKARATQKNLNKLAARYEQVYESLIETDTKLRKTNSNIVETQKRLAERQIVLNKRIKDTYKYGNIDFADVIFGSNTFSELVHNIEFLNKIASSDTRLIESIEQDKANLERQKNTLQVEKQRKSNIAGKLKREKRLLAKELGKQQAIMDRLKTLIKKDELAQMEAAKARRVSRTSARYSSRGRSFFFKARKGFTFPVVGSHAYTNDWGNPRSGGRRHKGTDIFARTGTPCVAVVSGNVVFKGGGLGGLTARLHGDDGNTYYYAHLSSYGRGGRVSAGTVIGYVGASGNARGTSPHLHFEIWPGGRGAINPYPVLRAAD